MRVRWSVAGGVFALGVLASAAVAQEAPKQGFKVWLGPSLGSRESQVLYQTFSSIGVAKDISRRPDESYQLYVDAFRVVSRPADVFSRTTTNEVLGAGIARLYKSKDQGVQGCSMALEWATTEPTRPIPCLELRP